MQYIITLLLIVWALCGIGAIIAALYLILTGGL